MKDALIHMEQLDTLQRYINQVREINQRLKERYAEKKGKWAPDFKGKTLAKGKSTSEGSYLGPGPMEIDAVNEGRKGNNKKKLKKDLS